MDTVASIIQQLTEERDRIDDAIKALRPLVPAAEHAQIEPTPHVNGAQNGHPVAEAFAASTVEVTGKLAEILATLKKKGEPTTAKAFSG